MARDTRVVIVALILTAAAVLLSGRSPPERPDAATQAAQEISGYISKFRENPAGK